MNWIAPAASAIIVGIVMIWAWLRSKSDAERLQLEADERRAFDRLKAKADAAREGRAGELVVIKGELRAERDEADALAETDPAKAIDLIEEQDNEWPAD